MGYKTIEKRDEYNKKYYAENKAILAEKKATKETCQFCNRIVSHQNMMTHMNTKLCMKRRNLLTCLIINESKPESTDFQ